MEVCVFFSFFARAVRTCRVYGSTNCRGRRTGAGGKQNDYHNRGLKEERSNKRYKRREEEGYCNEQPGA